MFSSVCVITNPYLTRTCECSMTFDIFHIILCTQGGEREGEREERKRERRTRERGEGRRTREREC